MKKRFTEEQIIGFLREADSGVFVKDLCQRHGFSELSYYLWRSKFCGMSMPYARCSEQSGEGTDTREEVRYMVDRGLSERHALRIFGMNANSITSELVGSMPKQAFRCGGANAKRCWCRIVSS